ncbi:MAG: alpha/beta hydrolase [Vagococcus sp.]|uniref:alpha/beta hydrolase n=1 Tax=Vagococcus sp. TaxID=1933889 RepID=UPI002FCB121C
MKKRIIIIFSVLFVCLLIGLGYGVHYLFDFAVVSGEKEFIKQENTVKLEQKWKFSDNHLEKIKIKSNDDLSLSARLISQEKQSKKVAIVAHGYMSEGYAMPDYANMFYEMGYDVLVPDNRGHGESEGKYVGFGWQDRMDYQQWIEKMIQLNGEDIDIVLFGVSMGASTVMMTSGETLPHQVKAIIADCGYTSVADELSYQLNDMFNLPSFPLIPLTSLYTKVLVGYSFYEASTVEQLKKNKLPLLLIHGDQDDFVPTEFVYTLRDATKGSKQVEIFKGANHATSFKTDSKRYKKLVKSFLSDYLN